MNLLCDICRRAQLALTALCLTLTAQAYTERDVTVDNPVAKITLAGTLTLPDGDVAPRAALVMATGSGGQDRDETFLGHKPFKTIAEHLSDAGYAVLRMDDRGVGESQGAQEGAVTDDFVGDALAGAAAVRQMYPALKVGILGHSEGGLIAIKSANTAGGADFIVTLGCPALKGDSMIMSQMRALTYAATGNDDMFNDAYAVQRQMLDIVGSPVMTPLKRAQMTMLMSEHRAEEMAVPQLREMLEKQIAQMTSPWYVEFIRYNPLADIRAVSVPWLAINGARDLQVTPENLEIIAANSGAETRLMPVHNHLLQRCDTGQPAEYRVIQEDIDPEVVQIIVKWLDEICK